MAVILSRFMGEILKNIYVTITGNGDSGACYVKINNTSKYYSPTTSVIVAAGDTIYMYASGRSNSGIAVYPTIQINGKVVAKENSSSVHYTWEVPRNISNINIAMAYSINSEGDWEYVISVTTS